MRISDWSSDVCSSDLVDGRFHLAPRLSLGAGWPAADRRHRDGGEHHRRAALRLDQPAHPPPALKDTAWRPSTALSRPLPSSATSAPSRCARSEAHTSELQSLMRSSYAVFCLNKKKTKTDTH